jgi:hypothetical protein
VATTCARCNGGAARTWGRRGQRLVQGIQLERKVRQAGIGPHARERKGRPAGPIPVGNEKWSGASLRFRKRCLLRPPHLPLPSHPSAPLLVSLLARGPRSSLVYLPAPAPKPLLPPLTPITPPFPHPPRPTLEMPAMNLLTGCSSVRLHWRVRRRHSMRPRWSRLQMRCGARVRPPWRRGAPRRPSSPTPRPPTVVSWPTLVVVGKAGLRQGSIFNLWSTVAGRL